MAKKSVPPSVALALIGCLFAIRICEGAPVQRTQLRTSESVPSITGKVVVPIAGFWDRLEVILEYETGVPEFVTYTDVSGAYTFYDLKPGRYFVLIEVDGFEKVRERADLIFLEVRPVRQVIFLSPVNSQSASPGASVVDVNLRRKYPKKAVDEFERAREDLADGDLEKSAQRLTTSLKEAPSFFEARSLLGTVYHRMRRYPDAELEYRKAHELDPKAVLPLINLGTLYMENAEAERDAAVTARLYQAAYTALTDATKLDARSATAAFLLGAASFKSSRIDEAETHLKRALELNARLGQAQIMLANVYIRRQNWENALQTLDAYLRDHKDAPEFRQIQETRTKVAERVNVKPD